MKRLTRAIAVCLCAASYARATNISIESQITPIVHGNTLDVTMTITNHGDEPAYNVQLRAEAAGLSKASPSQSSLAVGKSYTASFHYPIGALTQGRYPIMAGTLYTDANAYPFSALAVSLFSIQADPSSGILALLGQTQIQDRGRLNLKIKNLDGYAKKLHVRLYAPQELSTDRSHFDIDLSEDGEIQAPVPIHNYSALRNSTYAVFAVIEYDQNNSHHTALAPGTVFIAPPTLWSEMQGYKWMGLAGIAGLILLIGIRIRWERRIKNPERRTKT